MIRMFSRLGDRMLEAVVPTATADALTCTRGTCRNHRQRVCCIGKPCFDMNC